MAQNDIIVFGVDTSKTKKRIDDQLKRIVNELGNGNTFGMTAGLNKDQTRNKIQSQLNAITKELSLEVNVKTNYKDATNKAKDHHKQVTNDIDSEAQKRAAAAKKYADDMKRAEKEVAAERKKALAEDTLANNIKKAQVELLNLKNTYSAIGKDSNLSAEWQKLFDSSKLVKTRDDLTNFNSKLRLFKTEIGATGEAAAGSFAKMSASALALLVITKVAQTVISSIKNMVKEVENLDQSLTELNKVFDFTGDGLDKFVKRAYEAGAQIGRTGKEVIDGVTEFKRAGYELESSLNLSRAALMMTNIGAPARRLHCRPHAENGDRASHIYPHYKSFNAYYHDYHHNHYNNRY